MIIKEFKLFNHLQVIYLLDSMRFIFLNFKINYSCGCVAKKQRIKFKKSRRIAMTESEAHEYTDSWNTEGIWNPEGPRLYESLQGRA
jgi:hypothetical protein